MTLSIRPAILGDIDLLAAIENGRRYTANWKKEGFAGELALEEAAILTAFINEVPAGFIALKILGPQAEIVNLAVAEDMLKKGIGMALVKAALQCAKQRGCGSVILEVNTGNAAAISLYNKCGFKTAALRKNFYGDGSNAYTMLNALSM